MKKIINFLGFKLIHHYLYGFGYKLMFLNYGYFKKYSSAWKETPFQKLNKGKLYGANNQLIKNQYHVVK